MEWVRGVERGLRCGLKQWVVQACGCAGRLSGREGRTPPTGGLIQPGACSRTSQNQCGGSLASRFDYGLATAKSIKPVMQIANTASEKQI
jgi:hypothetical protein